MLNRNYYWRPIIRRDEEEVLSIERLAFEFPWSADDFCRCLRQRNCLGYVMEHRRPDAVIGYVIYELHKNRLHILNLATVFDFARRGVGSLMLDELKQKCSPRTRNRILCEVRETNVEAQLFFRFNGFRAVSVLRGFYEDTADDAYLMQWRLGNRVQPGDAKTPAALCDQECSGR